jgi:peptidoglycan/LPS O-acetylase OafA/YrhL
VTSSAPLGYSAYSERKYVPELDGLRALSVLLVVSAHMYDAETMWQWLSGYKGVIVFFVLSGYLITTLALREEREHGTFSLSAFYIRRCFRIFPLYYLTLAVYCLLILGLGFSPEVRDLMQRVLPYDLLYFQEVPFFYKDRFAFPPFAQSWTLGIEEKFYFFWPLIGFVLWRGRRCWRMGGTLGLAGVFALLPHALGMTDPRLQYLGACLSGYFPILMGCLLAFLLDDRSWFARLQVLGSSRASGLVWALFLTIHFATHWVGPLEPAWGILYTLAVSLLLVSTVLGQGSLPGLLRRPALVFVGKLSYGIYLIHVFALGLAHKIVSRLLTEPVTAGVLAYLLACALAIAAAMALHWSIEKPCIDLGRRLAARALRRNAPSGSSPPPVETVVARIHVDPILARRQAQPDRAAV